jgi:hypothetical protein
MTRCANATSAGMNRLFQHTIPVIPAKAGIQLFKKYPRSGSTSVFCTLRGLFVLLDFRLRGNDDTKQEECS